MNNRDSLEKFIDSIITDSTEDGKIAFDQYVVSKARNVLSNIHRNKMLGQINEFIGDSAIKLKGEDVLVNGKVVGKILTDLNDLDSGINFTSQDGKFSKEFETIEELYRYLTATFGINESKMNVDTEWYKQGKWHEPDNTKLNVNGPEWWADYKTTDIDIEIKDKKVFINDEMVGNITISPDADIILPVKTEELGKKFHNSDGLNRYLTAAFGINESKMNVDTEWYKQGKWHEPDNTKLNVNGPEWWADYKTTDIDIEIKDKKVFINDEMVGNITISPDADIIFTSQNGRIRKKFHNSDGLNRYLTAAFGINESTGDGGSGTDGFTGSNEAALAKPKTTRKPKKLTTNQSLGLKKVDTKPNSNKSKKLPHRDTKKRNNDVSIGKNISKVNDETSKKLKALKNIVKKG